MTEHLEQVPFSAIEFADNPEPRCPCLLLVDTSASMRGKPIEELNEGLIAFKDELAADSLASKRAEIALITFGPAQIQTDFQTADVFYPPYLTANSDTPMGSAIELGLEILNQRKNIYKQNGVDYYRPWIFLITDGAPTDAWKNAAAMVREGEEKGAFSFFAVGVEGANLEVLEQISVRKPLMLKELRFRDMFLWLSKSMKSVSQSRPGEAVPLANPTTPDGWATV